MEIWKDINGFDNYEVSTHGCVRNKKTGKILQPYSSKGYLRIKLYNNTKQQQKTVHILVALAFIPNQENKSQVDHIDNCKTNNNVENLRWATNQENSYNTQQTRNAKYICKNNNRYVVQVQINGKRMQKHARTIEEAIIIRDELLKQRNEQMPEIKNFIEKIVTI